MAQTLAPVFTSLGDFHFSLKKASNLHDGSNQYHVVHSYICSHCCGVTEYCDSESKSHMSTTDPIFLGLHLLNLWWDLSSFAWVVWFSLCFLLSVSGCPARLCSLFAPARMVLFSLSPPARILNSAEKTAQGERTKLNQTKQGLRVNSCLEAWRNISAFLAWCWTGHARSLCKHMTHQRSNKYGVCVPCGVSFMLFQAQDVGTIRQRVVSPQ